VKKILFLTLFLTSCAPTVDRYGITSTLIVNHYRSEEDALRALQNKANEVCLRHGYDHGKLVSRQTYGLREFKARGVAKCIKKETGY